MNASAIRPARALELAQIAVRAAARFVLDSHARLGHAAIESRSPSEVAASIEREAEALIRTRISAVFPEHAFVGRQMSGKVDARRPTWLIEAVDGGANYRHGYPQFAVSLALAHHNEAVVSVILDPNRDELFTAVRGGGAFRNTVKINVSKASKLSDALAATIHPAPTAENFKRSLADYGRMQTVFAAVRQSGSLALDLAHLAAGQLDAFWAYDLTPWQAAAGIALVREAGARVEALDDAPLLASRAMLATAPLLFTAARAGLTTTTATAATATTTAARTT